MENKKRDADEEVNLLNVYVGMKTDNFDSGLGISFGFKTFTTLEKMDSQIGIVMLIQMVKCLYHLEKCRIHHLIT